MKPEAPGQEFSEPAAQLPRPPILGGAAKEKAAEEKALRAQGEAVEHRSVLRGLILLAIVALVVSFFRAGVQRAFYPGWWRQW